MKLLAYPLITLLLTSCGGDDSSSNSNTDGGTEEQSRVVGYLRSDPYPKLILEIDSVPGFEPRAGAQVDLIDQLDVILDKPGGISATADGEITSKGSDHAWTDSELFALADETFDLDVPSDTTKIHVIFVDGHSARDSGSGTILGIAWSNTHLVMFKQSIDEVCSGPLTPPLLEEQICEAAEFSIWVHESGHVLGLVNTGLPMVNDHQDTEHGAHDVSDECVMYWAYEGEALVDVLRDRITGGNEAPLTFDEACLADIAEVRDDS